MCEEVFFPFVQKLALKESKQTCAVLPWQLWFKINQQRSKIPRRPEWFFSSSHLLLRKPKSAQVLCGLWVHKCPSPQVPVPCQNTTAVSFGSHPSRPWLETQDTASVGGWLGSRTHVHHPCKYLCIILPTGGFPHALFCLKKVFWIILPTAAKSNAILIIIQTQN